MELGCPKSVVDNSPLLAEVAEDAEDAWVVLTS
jgi:hypothetical protein